MPQARKYQRLMAGAGLALALAVAASPAARAVGVRSGLPWPSGVTKPAEAFGTWRGRPVDLRTAFWGKLTWTSVIASARVPAGPLRVALGFPMLPVSNRGQLEQCAGGAFDAQMRAVRDNMLAAGWRGSFVRLGWEANRVDGFPWAVKGDGASYVGCFRRWVGILNPGRVKNFTIVWNMGNRGTFPYPIARMYPGDDVVDVVASNFYDMCPPITDEAAWLARINARDGWGNPAGPQAWLAFAKARGKKWALPEWGIGGAPIYCNRPGFDNPFFIRKMFEFLRANARDIAFETYFNGYAGDRALGTHELYPSDRNPRAAAVYRSLW